MGYQAAATVSQIISIGWGAAAGAPSSTSLPVKNAPAGQPAKSGDAWSP